MEHIADSNQNNMAIIEIDGIEYVRGSRVPVQPIREMVKKYKAEEARQLDDDLSDWYQENDIVQQVADYTNKYGIILNDNAIDNIIKEVQV